MADQAREAAGRVPQGEASDAADAPNRELPLITEAGVARFTGTAWRAWLVEQGIAVGKVEAGRPLRELGFVMRAFSLPGEGRALGMYLGRRAQGDGEAPPAQGGPQGRRWRPAHPFGKLSPAHVAVLVDALVAAPQSDERDELLALLPAKAA